MSCFKRTCRIRDDQGNFSYCFKSILLLILYAFILYLIFLLCIFVLTPIIFKYAKGVHQRSVFPYPKFDSHYYGNLKFFDIKGVINSYWGYDNMKLGFWFIVHENEIANFSESTQFSDKLLDNNYTTLVYLGRHQGDRADSVPLYKVLRKHFQIFAVDYRGTADSTYNYLTKTFVVRDVVTFYKSLKEYMPQKNNQMYIWGHGITSAVAVYAAAALQEDNIPLHGLILETTFSTVVEMMAVNTQYSWFSFVPWFHWAMLQPLIDNDLNFDVESKIIKVDCPILMLHAKDDMEVSYHLAEKVYNAICKKKGCPKDKIMFKTYETLGYKNNLLASRQDLPKLISEFKQNCEKVN